ncbi:hypothetical protein FA95DRAFT_1582974 [Auriscalpium vulgare]|uniref:Uncharacterized protein n=1 Tax=Auriscalpium vulgare TaxID=40419 RepID=A0ACB8RRG6_9AGAM|nr:hypothetical protein FA95DRAFT_1582974 [Auriscalpium vulgare]
MATTASAIDASPPPARWMTESLDRTAFRRTIPVLAARVPAAETTALLKADALRRSIINLPKVRSVVGEHTDARKLVLLRVQREVPELTVCKPADLTPEAKEYLLSKDAELTTYTLELDYNYWTADEILQAVLPEDLLHGSPTGFAITGHLAHMNLNDEYLPYKHIIGQVVLDKNKRLRTVVNKLDSIDTQFRFFKMELLAGDPDYIVTHHESNCAFTFDFTRVYWNSRLHTEHERLVALFSPEDLVADVFAGVGPFAIPAAKKGCAVFANDLNPESHKYLQVNIDGNKVGDLVRASCEDGRAFIRDIVGRAAAEPLSGYAGPKTSRSQLQKQRKQQLKQLASYPDPSTAQTLPEDSSPSPPVPPRRRIAHFVMNLPDSAITFLDAFRGLLAASPDLAGLYADGMPMVHCHCFTRELEAAAAERDIRTRVAERLGWRLGAEDEVSLHLVRSVAPNKDMYCISFRLPRQVAFAPAVPA